MAKLSHERLVLLDNLLLTYRKYVHLRIDVPACKTRMYSPTLLCISRHLPSFTDFLSQDSELCMMKQAYLPLH
jgi:hypothetical protein